MDLLTTKQKKSLIKFLPEWGEIKDWSFQLLPGGANNKVFCVQSPKVQKKMLLKVYFKHQQDMRDRLGAEYAFCQFAWEHGIDYVPQPYFSDAQNNYNLFEFIEGQPFAHDKTNKLEHLSIDEALCFFKLLNKEDMRKEALKLPKASESCFSLEEHVDCVEQRLQRLLSMDRQSEIDEEVYQFAGDVLAGTWRRIVFKVGSMATKHGVPPDAKLPNDEQCLSPSDFGFHNSIRANDGRLRFIDFEYAGWDDPAKTVCDFFCQKKVPVPLKFYNCFLRELAALFPKSGLDKRASILLPVYQFKWCCIVLNDFLPVDGVRRCFAHGAESILDRKIKQFKLAKEISKAIQC